MQNFIRAFVAVLALTGAVATASTNSSSSNSAGPVLTRTSAYPIPHCPPDDGSCWGGPNLK